MNPKTKEESQAMKSKSRTSKNAAAAIELATRIADTLASYRANIAAGDYTAAAGDSDALARLGRCLR